jgi:hypothetical protein
MYRNFLILIFMAVSTMVQAQQKNVDAVAAAVEQLRVAMLDANEQKLGELTSGLLSYGHSAGLVEDKKEFIRRIVSGENDYTELLLSGQSIALSGNTAIVRHRVDAKILDKGKPTEPKLLVLQIWQKKGPQWVLLARQAVKIVQ